ncbi:MAG: hypothetical protein ACRDX8_03385 [Acidimicrobiales bacterium]
MPQVVSARLRARDMARTGHYEWAIRTTQLRITQLRITQLRITQLRITQRRTTQLRANTQGSTLG